MAEEGIFHLRLKELSLYINPLEFTSSQKYKRDQHLGDTVETQQIFFQV